MACIDNMMSTAFIHVIRKAYSQYNQACHETVQLQEVLLDLTVTFVHPCGIHHEAKKTKIP